MGNAVFADLLVRVRLHAGMSRQQLAELSTLSARAIRNLEQGRVARPRRETVQLIADALRVDDRARRALLDVALDPCTGPDRDYGPAPTSSAGGAAPGGAVSRYEYREVALPRGGVRSGAGAELLNREAGREWRLAAVDSGVAFLERTRPWGPAPPPSDAPPATAPAIGRCATSGVTA